MSTKAGQVEKVSGNEAGRISGQIRELCDSQNVTFSTRSLFQGKQLKSVEIIVKISVS